MTTSRHTAALDTAAGVIRHLLEGSETEFLGIGEELTDLLGYTDRIAKDAHEAMAATEVAADAGTGARIGADVAAIRGVVERGRAVASESGARLVALEKTLARLERLGSEFRRIVQTLRSLASLTRMEGARVGLEQSGFTDVGTDIAALASVVQDRFGALLESVVPLRGQVSLGLGKTRDGGVDAAAELRAVASTAENLLGINREARTRMVRVGEVVRAMTAALGQVVMSLQSHDITRQQLEHVAEALEEARGKLASEGDSEALLHAADVCSLLVGQVRHTRLEITGAVTELCDSLRAIGQRVRGIEDELGSVSHASHPILRDLEARLTVALGVLDESRARAATIAASATHVSTVVAELSEFVRDIDDIGEKIHLIAFNAVVRSARTGEAGRAVGALSGEIQVVAADTQVQTATAKAALNTVAAEAAQLQEATRPDAEGERRTAETAGDLRDLLAQLAAADTAIFGGLTRVGADSRALQERVEQVASGITYHLRAGHTLQRLEAYLGALATALGEASGTSHRGGRADRLRAHLDRYTMDSERQVHASLLGAGGAPPAQPSHGNDLGGNVELF